MPFLAALIVAASGTTAMLPKGWSALCPPRSRPDEIVVCVDRDPPPSPYRVPLPGPRTFGERGTASVSAERNGLLGPDVGTIGNCSTWGPGGLYGCSFQRFRENRDQAAGSRDPRGRVYEKQP
jgi:hypothetical protein